ncbi:MAG: hydrogenase iron-sulfur subunit [Syntrophobacter sp.]
MNNGIKTGLFLCDCGRVIGKRLDLEEIGSRLNGRDGIISVHAHSRYCLAGGLYELVKTVEAEGLNRVLMGACSDRIMKERFMGMLRRFGIMESQIEMVNLKDHIALVHDNPRDELTYKAEALLAGAAASLFCLEPHPPTHVEFGGPVLIVGGGVSGFEAARELARNRMECILFSDASTPEDALVSLLRRYPGSRLFADEMEALLKDVYCAPYVTILPDRPLEYLDGHTGDYRLGTVQPDGTVEEISGSTVILAVDRKFAPGLKPTIGGCGHVLDQVELEDNLASGAIRSGRVVFWVNGQGNGLKFQEMSVIAAWNNSQFIVKKYPRVKPTILYPAGVRLPSTDESRVGERARCIEAYAYDPDVHPVVQSGYVTFVGPGDHLEHEIKWDNLVVSSEPCPISASKPDLIRYLPVFADEIGIKKAPLKVKATHEPVKWPIIAGSAMEPCDLSEALRQGKRAAREAIRLRKKARDGSFASPLMVVSVDKDLCQGCGLCNEICTCGAVQNIRPGKGPVPREVDPHLCDGGGSCAAACPYGAMKVLNNSSQQLEARVRAVISHMKEKDVLGFACGWGAQGASELAAVRKYTYSSRLFLIPVRCLGIIDPTILSMAFLNGANFILMAGCTPSASCHYGYGVDHTWYRVSLMKKLLGMSGLERQRISLGYVEVNEPDVFVRMVESFLSEVDRMKPIDRGENSRKLLLAAHSTLHRPRMRWVLGASLRRPSEPRFPGNQLNAVDFDEVVQEVLEEEYLAARIVGALDGTRSLNPPEIAGALGERPIIVSKALGSLVEEGRVICEYRAPYPLFSLPRAV